MIKKTILFFRMLFVRPVCGRINAKDIPRIALHNRDLRRLSVSYDVKDIAPVPDMKRILIEKEMFEDDIYGDPFGFLPTTPGDIEAVRIASNEEERR